MNNSSRLIFILVTLISLASCRSFSPEYQLKEHPLIDKIWSVQTQNFVTIETVKKQILDADVILLGETHDNARHHQLQGLFINHLVQNQRFPAVAYEMLDHPQQESINQFQKSHKDNTGKTDQFAIAINWDESGWPEWPYYRPAFYPAIENNLTIIAANQDLKFIRKAIKQGTQALDESTREMLTKYQYEGPLKQALEQEILSAHCDMLPEKMLGPMLLGQQVRDISMTQSILAALHKNNNQGVILVAGTGHTRTDYGVPLYVRQEVPNKKIISIAFIEVSEGALHASDYAENWLIDSQASNTLPFDYVWFTPLAKREDQCEKMKAHMKKKKAN